MKTITTTTGIELLIVPVPEDAEYFEVLELIKKEVKNIKNFPRQGWNILGSVTKDTIDFDCSELVNNPCKCGSGKYCKHNSDSFLLLLQSTGVTFENPYEYTTSPIEYLALKNSPDYRKKMERKYKEAEKNVVKKIVVIQKLKP